MERLRAAEHRGERLDRRTHDVVERLLCRERGAHRLGVEAQRERRGVGDRVAVAQDKGPDAPRGAVLGHLLDERRVGGEEERELWCETLDREAAPARGIHVGDRVREREGELLHRARARLADVVAGDRDNVPARQVLGAPGEHVGDDP